MRWIGDVPVLPLAQAGRRGEVQLEEDADVVAADRRIEARDAEVEDLARELRFRDDVRLRGIAQRDGHDGDLLVERAVRLPGRMCFGSAVRAGPERVREDLEEHAAVREIRHERVRVRAAIRRDRGHVLRARGIRDVEDRIPSQLLGFVRSDEGAGALSQVGFVRTWSTETNTRLFQTETSPCGPGQLKSERTAGPSGSEMSTTRKPS